MKGFLLSIILFTAGAFGQTIVSVTPNSGNLGEQLTVTITGDNTTFLSVVGTDNVNFFNMLSQQFIVNSVNPVSNTILIVDITIPTMISTGSYNLLVASTFNTAFMDNAFNVGSLASQDFEYKSSLSLWPNPATEKFTLTLPATFADSAICTIVDMQGRQVYRSTVFPGSNQINIANLSKGTYIVNVADGSKNGIKKLIKN